jgi:hypothetical protein
MKNRSPQHRKEVGMNANGAASSLTDNRRSDATRAPHDAYAVTAIKICGGLPSAQRSPDLSHRSPRHYRPGACRTTAARDGTFACLGGCPARPPIRIRVTSADVVEATSRCGLSFHLFRRGVYATTHDRGWEPMRTNETEAIFRHTPSETESTIIDANAKPRDPTDEEWDTARGARIAFEVQLVIVRIVFFGL